MSFLLDISFPLPKKSLQDIYMSRITEAGYLKYLDITIGTYLLQFMSR